ncbi:hypothetical protein [Flavobacterium pectinovorum]|jgi:hypothetical protein|uniref:EF-hand domain-containing protein n=1 Tax=Flavobacterium pectinovorum TaxID=29533 RepID=A0A502F5X9_9FLAO|nr:hypothetical protein [Flavobacterium pectinovorum]TPG44071.1 hypothetical protein EAH81_05845 [Flavobacterium pectinovorum]
MTKFITLFFLLFSAILFAQNNNFNKTITKVKGDLNKDGLIDYVQVLQDSISETAPYKLEIYFAEANGNFKKVVSTTQAIDAQYPDGRNGYYNGNSFYKIDIVKGILSIQNELIRGNFEHKFRYQNGNFELIGFSQVYSDGQGTMGTIDFNLSTGIRIKTTEPYGEDDFPKTNSKQKIMIKPLPKLQDFSPFKNEYY